MRKAAHHPALDTEQTRAERNRAYDRFTASYATHSAAIHVFDWLAARPDATDAIAATLRIKKGLGPSLTAERAKSLSKVVLTVVADERARGYAFIRSAAVVAVCGSFEYLVKAAFVDQAAENPAAAAALLSKTKLRVAAADVLGTTPAELWFAIADRLFEQLAEHAPLAHERTKRFLVDYTFLPFGEAQLEELNSVLAKVDARLMNVAFLVRNCLVHNGGRVSSALSRMTSAEVGSEIKLAGGRTSKLIEQIRLVAEHLNGMWFSSII